MYLMSCDAFTALRYKYKHQKTNWKLWLWNVNAQRNITETSIIIQHYQSLNMQMLHRSISVIITSSQHSYETILIIYCDAKSKTNL